MKKSQTDPVEDYSSNPPLTLEERLDKIREDAINAILSWTPDKAHQKTSDRILKKGDKEAAKIRRAMSKRDLDREKYKKL